MTDFLVLKNQNNDKISSLIFFGTHALRMIPYSKFLDLEIFNIILIRIFLEI